MTGTLKAYHFFCLKQDKDDEIAMLRGLVRQQEDATRLLGEKLRNEAQEHVSSGDFYSYFFFFSEETGDVCAETSTGFCKRGGKGRRTEVCD